nr:dUTP diphosphatase [uncultured bacterium]
MPSLRVNIKKLHPDAKAPFYATPGSAGCDFYSIEDVTLAPEETKKIRTGIAIEIPTGYFTKLEGRSGLSARGLLLTGGVIDADYRGEVHIVLHNSTKMPFFIEKGDRIAQGVLMPILQANFHEVDKLSETQRGAGGFQSTGIK